MAVPHPSRWQIVATQYFPGERLGFAADVYQAVAREAAGVCLNISVELDSGVSVRSVDAVFDLATAGEQVRREALAAAAYRVGYRAQLDDTAVGNYDRLNELVAILDENREGEETTG